MKRRSIGKILLICGLCLVLAGSAAFGIWYFLQGRPGTPVNVYPFEYLGMTEYWGDSQESQGYVRAENIQTVYLSDTQTVTEILVEEGAQVKKGDVLLRFDTTLSDLALERKRLDVEKLKLQLEDAKTRLREINAMRPMVIPQPSDDPEEEVDLGELLLEPFRISEDPAFDGSTGETALICWLHSASSISSEILDAILLKAEEYRAINAEKEPEAQPGEDPAPSVPTEATEPTAATEPTEVTAPVEGTEPSDPTLPEDPGDPSEPPQEEAPDKWFYVVFKVTEQDRALGAKAFWQGIYVILDGEGEYSFKFFDASLVRDHTLAPDEEEEEKPEIDFGSGYTASQIAQMRAEQEKRIKELEFEIKMAEANYKIAQTEVSDGTVRAQLDGVVVSLLTQDEAKMQQLPILKVSAGGGFRIEGTVSEMDRDTLFIGREVTVMDWYTGMTYTGTVESLGDYPSSDNGWNGNGNPTSSYYPFRVFVDGSAELRADNYVSLTFAAAEGENGIYLENPFIRTEGGRAYVYVRGEGELLEKRWVTTGKSLWGSYTEILEGITATDLIAFPYGKDVKEGAPTVESDLSSLYE